jgi:spoIIIJ-associated protein
MTAGTGTAAGDGAMREELHGEVKTFVEQILHAMGLSVAVEVSDLEDGSVRVDVQGEEGELLLRRKGEGLDALQHLVNSAYRRDVGRDQRIVIDAMGFRQGKDVELQQMARFLVEKVRTSGASQELGPLNSYARRIVHLEVGRHDDVASESQGDGQLKQVIISLRRPSR